MLKCRLSNCCSSNSNINVHLKKWLKRRASAWILNAEQLHHLLFPFSLSITHTITLPPPPRTPTLPRQTDRCRRSHHLIRQRRCGSIPVCSVGSSGPWCCACSWRMWRCSGSRCSCSGWSGRSTHSLKEKRQKSSVLIGVYWTFLMLNSNPVC